MACWMAGNDSSRRSSIFSSFLCVNKSRWRTVNRAQLMRNFSLRSRLAARVDWWPSKWKPNKHSKVRRFNIVFTFARNHMPSACLFGLENFSPISWFNERACGDSSAIEWGYTSSVRSPFGSIASEKKNQFLVFLLIIITIVSRIRYHDSRPRFSTHHPSKRFASSSFVSIQFFLGLRRRHSTWRGNCLH